MSSTQKQGLSGLPPESNSNQYSISTNSQTYFLVPSIQYMAPTRSPRHPKTFIAVLMCHQHTTKASQACHLKVIQISTQSVLTDKLTFLCPQVPAHRTSICLDHTGHMLGPLRSHAQTTQVCITIRDLPNFLSHKVWYNH